MRFKNLIQRTNLSEHCIFDLVVISAPILPVMLSPGFNLLNLVGTIVAVVAQTASKSSRIQENRK